MESAEGIGRKPQRPRFDFEQELLEDETAYEDSSRDRMANNNNYPDPEYFERRHGPSSSSPYNDTDSEYRHFSNSESYKENITLGQYIMDRVGDAVKGVFGNSQTILRVDLRQAIRYDGPALQKQTRGLGRPRKQAVVDRRDWEGRMAARVSETGYEYESDQQQIAAVQSRGWFHGIQGGGARLKLMQIWDFKDLETGEERLPWDLNVGFGANIVMDRGEVQPKVRIRSQYAAFHFFPDPYLELRGKWPLFNTNLALRARYRIPVSSMSKFWESTSSQIMVNLHHQSGTGIHLTPGGVEFEDQKFPIGKFGTMRVAASVDFPRKFPLEEGEQPFRLQITQLGLKSRIL